MRTLLFALFLALSASAADSWIGLCVSIADGDAIIVLRDKEQVTITLYGIDCPESQQDYGTRARQTTGNLAYRQIVTVIPIDSDRNGRTAALVEVDGISLNETLLQVGLAWVYNSFCRIPQCEKWRELEAEARSARKGLWEQKDPIPPWDWRRGRRSAEPPESTQAKPYHGNSSSRVFHKDSCKNYDCRSCTSIFISRAAAINAGYKPCDYCKP